MSTWKRSINFVFLLCCGCIFFADGFLPNHLNPPSYLKGEDWTLSGITRRGILLAVATYFENTPLAGRPPIYPGNLTGLDPLTPTTLYDAYYGDRKVSPQKFDKAITDIADVNSELTKSKKKKAKWHFNGEQIQDGQTQMIKTRESLLGILDDDTPNYDTARQVTGQFLHLLHSFYSNTDYVELWQHLRSEDTLEHHRDLGIDGKDYFPAAPADRYTCKNCVYKETGKEKEDCSKNMRELRDGWYLTSGYRSKQNIEKPESNSDEFGKCSHGGKKDKTSDEVALGGINKEVNDSKFSPHYFHHFESADLAISHTVDTFIAQGFGILNVSGKAAFRGLLNLGTGASLVFVIDETGSMSDEIEAVKEEAIQIVQDTYGTYDAPYNYVVVPFNDPIDTFTPHLVTTDADEAITFIDSLSASGGGDCPELANTGLEMAIHKSLFGSEIYVFTDASDKDFDKADDVAALAKLRMCTVHYILTGDCAGTSKSENQNENHKAPENPVISVSDSYTKIATASGGNVFTTSKSHIGDMTEIIQIGIGSSKVTIKKWYGKAPEPEAGIPFFVDETISEISIVVSADYVRPRIDIMDPNGFPVPNNESDIDIVVDVDNVIALNASDPMSGQWMVHLGGYQFYDVEVSAQSVVDFSYQFLELDDESGLTYPTASVPVAGASSNITVQVIGREYIDDTDIGITLMNTTGNPIESYTLQKTADNNYITEMIVPFQSFSMRLDTIDTHNNVLRRLQPTLIQPQDFKLEFSEADRDPLHPGDSVAIPFILTNFGGETNFTIRASTDIDVHVNPEPAFVTLPSGGVTEGNVVLIVPDGLSYGTTIVVILTATSYDGAATSVINSFLVEEPITEIVDNVPPRCNITSQENTCTAEMMDYESCSLYTWSITFEVTEKESVISSINTFPANKSFELFYGSDQFLNGTFRSDCCCPLVTINVQDFYGNLGQCSVNFYAPVQDVVEPPKCLGEPPLPVTTAAPTTKGIETKFPTTQSTTVPNSKEPVKGGVERATVVGIFFAVCGATLLIIGFVIGAICYRSRRMKVIDETVHMDPTPPNYKDDGIDNVQMAHSTSHNSIYT